MGRGIVQFEGAKGCEPSPNIFALSLIFWILLMPPCPLYINTTNIGRIEYHLVVMCVFSLFLWGFIVYSGVLNEEIYPSVCLFGGLSKQKIIRARAMGLIPFPYFVIVQSLQESAHWGATFHYALCSMGC